MKREAAKSHSNVSRRFDAVSQIWISLKKEKIFNLCRMQRTTNENFHAVDEDDSAAALHRRRRLRPVHDVINISLDEMSMLQNFEKMLNKFVPIPGLAQ